MRLYAPPLPLGVRRYRMPPLVRYAMAAASEVVHDRVALTAACILGAVCLVAVFAPYIAPWDPADKDVLRRLKPPVWEEGGSWANVLGTDHLGRDVLSRLIYGARVSLLVGFGVVMVAGTFGTVMGMLAGYYGGKVDDLISRTIDVQTAFPGLLLALVILTMVGPSLETVVLVLAINGWMVYARMARGQVLSLREQQFFEAAVAVGCKARRIIFAHVLPNLASPILTLAALEMARVILAEAILSFLGMGVQPPATSWGLMIAEGQDYLANAWWLVTLPGLTIGLTVLAVNLLASWLRTNADPAQRFRQGASDV